MTRKAPLGTPYQGERTGGGHCLPYAFYAGTLADHEEIRHWEMALRVL